MTEKPFKIERRKPKTATITLRVPPSLLKEYADLSIESGQSKNHLINMAMEEFLKNVTIEKKKS